VRVSGLKEELAGLYAERNALQQRVAGLEGLEKSLQDSKEAMQVCFSRPHCPDLTLRRV